MSSPFPFTLILARAPLRRRGALAWTAACLLFLAGLLGSGAAQATVYTFNGNAVYTCTLSNKVYTCPYPAYLDWDDSVVIGSGYTLKVTNNVAVTWNQGLTMGSGSKLIVTGNLNLKDVNPANLKITGGDIEVGGTFSMGASAQSATANITAGAIQFGTDRVTITGNLTSKGVVNISSHSRITGNISGTVVTTGSPVTIKGNVTASSKFTLASGSTVTGQVSAPVFDMLASGSKVTGNVTASSSMTMGSGNSVTGNVDTGDLLLQSSSALITGDARVNWATLEWAGRVAGTIYCKNGTKKNSCDCVTNNSGFAVNSANGPRCEAVAPKGVHHFQISHDGQAHTCVPETVTVTACANAACTAPHYTDGVTGLVLQPGNVAIDIGSSGINSSGTVSKLATGTIALSLGNLPASAGATTCLMPSGSTSCNMNFAGGATFKVNVKNHVSASTQDVEISAVKLDAQAQACVPALAGKKNVAFSCQYLDPASGSKTVTLGSAPTTIQASCDGTAASLLLDFNASTGIAGVKLNYPDAGKVKLIATHTSADGDKISGSDEFIAAPAKFVFTGLPAANSTIRAGEDFSFKIQAQNSAGALTPNFDKTALSGKLSAVETALEPCTVPGLNKGNLGATTTSEFLKGEAGVTLSWSEVGKMGLKAKLTDFLGSSLAVEGGTACDAIGNFIPHHFHVALADPAAKFYYSSQPFGVVVTARNKGKGTTSNYNKATGLSQAVTLSAWKEDGSAANPGPGVISAAAIGADDFENGVARPKPAYALTPPPPAPLKVRVRASNAQVTSKDQADAEQALPLIRFGRLRIANRFGSARAKLALPVMAEYWSGNSWVLNTDDDSTVVPFTAFVLRPNTQASALAALAVPKPDKDLAIKAGMGELILQPGKDSGAGWVDVVFNLGETKTDSSCLALPKPDSTGAKLPWLRSLNNACATTYTVDPYARATFGVFAPESRRIIHIREGFR